MTRHLIQQVKEHLEANKEELQGKFINASPDILRSRFDDLMVLKGQIYTWEYLSNLAEFLEIEEEDINEKIQTFNV